uniref:Uncharacterized protein n=1 Tax=viral metagenome TaxID=1070528 RepID=A0A6H1ZXY8_9ZZZZ
MFRTVDERKEKEFEALKKIVKENWRYDMFLAGIMAIWPLIFVLFWLSRDSFGIILYVAASVVVFGIGIFGYLFYPLPRRFKILETRR